MRKITNLKSDRVGDLLWMEWDGEGFLDNFDNSVFFTLGHISLDEDVVRRALASAIQRDGIVDSLGDGFKIIDLSEAIYSWAGHIDSDIIMNICNEDGYTDYGDLVTEVSPITLVKF